VTRASNALSRTIAMARKAKVKSVDIRQIGENGRLKQLIPRRRQRLAGLRALLRLDIAFFDNPSPFGDFILYVLAKLRCRHRDGRGTFAFKRRQQFGRL
jgi:hypothetical protein